MSLYTAVLYITNRCRGADLISKQDDRLAPAYFSLTKTVFDQLLQTVKKQEYCFAARFQRFPTNINSTTEFYTSWHYRLITPPKQSTKPEAFFESPFESCKLTCETLIVEIQPVV